MKAHELLNPFDQMGLEPADPSKVLEVSEQIKGFIDADVEEDQRTADLKDIWKPLSNDEKMRIERMLADKAPGTNQMYKSILIGYIKET
jgi:hypothetical protein